MGRNHAVQGDTLYLLFIFTLLFSGLLCVMIALCHRDMKYLLNNKYVDPTAVTAATRTRIDTHTDTYSRV